MTCIIELIPMQEISYLPFINFPPCNKSKYAMSCVLLKHNLTRSVDMALYRTTIAYISLPISYTTVT